MESKWQKVNVKKTKVIISNKKARKFGKEGKCPCAVCIKVGASERTIRLQIFFKISVLKKFHKFHRKTPVFASYNYYITIMQKLIDHLCNFIKNRFQHRCFPREICKIFKYIFFFLRWLSDLAEIYHATYILHVKHTRILDVYDDVIDVFTTIPNIYDAAFLRKYLNVPS